MNKPTGNEQGFQHALVYARHQAGVSQEALAAIAGLDRSFVSLLERGQRTPTLKTIFLLAEALDISATELVRLTEHFGARNSKG